VSRWVAGILTTEAIDLLACSERTAWRLRAASLARATDGLAHMAIAAAPRRVGSGR
jgi:hypothetical protein